MEGALRSLAPLPAMARSITVSQPDPVSNIQAIADFRAAREGSSAN